MRPEFLEQLVCPYTKGPLRLTEEYQSEKGCVEYGLLQSEAGDFPVIAGIPVLFAGQERLIGLLRSHRFGEAVAVAALNPIPRGGIFRFGEWLGETYRFRAIGNKISEYYDRPLLKRGSDILLQANGSVASIRSVFEFAYKECRIRPKEVFNYNYYRYGIPRHLVALSFIQSLPDGEKPVLDLACGAGHITWALQRKLAGRRPLIGLDGFFFSLLVAKKRIVPDAWCVCGDVNALPFRDGSLASVFCSDAFFNFGSKWSSLRELERVTDETGVLMLVVLRNKLRKHLYPGRPLTPQGYRKLVEHLKHRLFADSVILSRYLERKGLPASDAAEEELSTAETISIWAAKPRGMMNEETLFQQWPHADGVLGVNPLFVPEARNGEMEYVRKFPSEFYEKENREMELYLPERFRLSGMQEESMKLNRPEGLDELLATCAILGFPPGYLEQGV